MSSKYSEAQQCVNTLGLLSNKSDKGNIDMNNVARNELTFHNVTFNPIVADQQVWLTSAELAKALKYSSTKSISTLYSRNADEFTPAMTQVIEMMTSGNYRKKVRVFSIRGAHLIAMFATTPVAKEFRRWVLDILDREVAQTPESSPLHRYHTKVTVRDNLFGGEIEFYGKAEDLNAIATGICRTLGFEPSGFKQIPMDAKRVGKIH